MKFTFENYYKREHELSRSKSFGEKSSVSQQSSFFSSLDRYVRQKKLDVLKTSLVKSHQVLTSGDHQQKSGSSPTKA